MKTKIACPCGHSQRHDCCSCAKRRFDETLQTARDLLDSLERLDNMRVLLDQAESTSPALPPACSLPDDHIALVRTRSIEAIVAQADALADYLRCCAGGDR